MGLITFIRHNMPEPIEKACKEMRMKDEVIKRMYDAIPRCYKNKYHYKEAISKIKLKFFSIVERKTAIYHLIDMSDVDDLTKWEQLDEKIKNNIDYAR